MVADLAWAVAAAVSSFGAGAVFEWVLHRRTRERVEAGVAEARAGREAILRAVAGSAPGSLASGVDPRAAVERREDLRRDREAREVRVEGDILAHLAERYGEDRAVAMLAATKAIAGARWRSVLASDWADAIAPFARIADARLKERAGPDPLVDLMGGVRR